MSDPENDIGPISDEEGGNAEVDNQAGDEEQDDEFAEEQNEGNGENETGEYSDAEGNTNDGEQQELFDDEAEEVGDFEEEDHDEDEPEGEDLGPEDEPSSKRHKAADARRFFDEEAEVSGDDDEGGEGDEEVDEDEDVGLDDDEYYDNRAEAGVHHLFDEETANVRSMADHYDARAGELIHEDREAEQTRLPAVEDPKLFLIPVKPGKEPEAIFAIMRRFYNRQLGPPKGRFLIKSAFTTPASRGFVYVEAMKEAHVKHALDQLAGLFHWKTKLVPIREMVTAVSIHTTNVRVRHGQWIRLKRGIYKGDLAQIRSITDQGTRARVKMIPRIDYALIRSGGKRKRGAARPPANLFDPAEIEKLDEEHKLYRTGNQAGSFGYQWRNNFYKEGFLLKEMKVANLQTQNVNPSLEEIEKFKSKEDDGDEDNNDRDDDLEAIAHTSKELQFAKGDRVKVIKGDMKNLTGRVLTSVDDIVSLEADLKEVQEPLNFFKDELAKHFVVGDHVKVLSGKYKGETGLILQVNEAEKIVQIYSDISSIVMKVFAADVVESTEVCAGKDRLGNYALHDLVMIGQGEFAIIIKIENFSFKVLDTRGNISTVRLQDVSKKLNSRFGVAYDHNQNQVGARDKVKVVEDSQHRGKKGEVKHIYRSHLFLYNRQVYKTSGMFVVHAKNCILIGSDGRPRSAGRLQNMSAPKSPYIGAGGMGGHQQRQQRQPRQIMFINRRRRDKEGLEGKIVIITRGKYKSYKGKVTKAMEGTYRVKLVSKPKIVTIKREDVIEPEEVHRPRGDDWREQRDNFGGATPLIGGQTPRNDAGGRTPMHIPMTPSHDGSMTPGAEDTSWNPGALASTPYTSHGDGIDHDEGGWGSGDVQTPHTPTTAPMTKMETPHTPMTFNPNSPFPSSHGLGVATPHTPAAPTTPYAPATPMEEEKGREYGGGGLSRDIAVLYNGEEGVVRDLLDNAKVLVVLKTGKEVRVSEEDVELVKPMKGDKVKILRGEGKGGIAVLVSKNEEVEDEVVVQHGTAGLLMPRLQDVGKYVPRD